MMETSAERALAQYATVYEQVYSHAPQNVSILSGEWLIVNGAQLRASELMRMTDQLRQEHQAAQARKGSLTARIGHLIGFSS